MIRYFISSTCAFLLAMLFVVPAHAATNLITDIHTDGSQNVYNATTSSDVGNGNALLYAVSQAQNGDSFYLASGTFDLGSSTIDESMGYTGSFSIHGSGQSSTIIESSYGSLSSITPVIQAATSSQTTDMSIFVLGTSTPAIYAAPWGSKTNQGSFSGALLQNVNFKGFTDGIYVGSGAGAGGPYNATLRNVNGTTTWDVFVVLAKSRNLAGSSTINIYNSNFYTDGSNVLGGGAFARCVYVGYATVNIYNSNCTAIGGSINNYGFSNASVGTGGINGILTVIGGSIKTSQYDLINIAGGHALTQITPDVVYNGAQTSGSIVTIPPLLPVLQASSTGLVTPSSAVLNATLLSNGGAPVTVEGFNYGTTTNYGQTISVTGSFINNDFSQTASNLSCNTTYHYQAFAINSTGTATTSDQTFTTVLCAPTVILGSPSSITMSSLSLNASIVSDGGASSTVRGFAWGTTPTYTSTTTESGTFGISNFSTTISPLSCGNTYHYVVYAINSTGITTTADSVVTTTACSSASYAGGSISTADLSKILTPGTSTTAYLNSRTPQSVIVATISEGLFKNTFGVLYTDQEVKKLQMYLNSKGYTLASSGPGSAGQETTYFGIRTKTALMRFQKDHGITATGYFGPITSAYINAHL